MQQFDLWGASTPSSEDSPAKTLAPQEQERASTASGLASGSRCFESFGRWSRWSSSLRTCLLSELEAATGFSRVYIDKGTPGGLSWWVLGTSSPRTDGTGFLFSESETATTDWLTPAATPYGSSQNGINGVGGKNERPSAGTPSLETMAREWITPNTRDWKDTGVTQGNRKSPNLGTMAQWPTATAGDAKSSGAAGYSTESGRHTGTTLTDAISGPRGQANRKPNGSRDVPPGERQVLSPNWVEALMGFPTGYSLASETSVLKLWATPSSRKSAKSSAEPSSPRSQEQEK